MVRFILPTALLCVFLLAGLSCKKESTSPSGCDCQTVESCRSGARCNDGTTSSSTGQGACSGHGGVDRWICR